MITVAPRRRLIRTLPTGGKTVEVISPMTSPIQSTSSLNRSPVPAPARVVQSLSSKDLAQQAREELLGKSNTTGRTGSSTANWRGTR
ncbi:MAG: hypothetical protein WC813_04970 [Patescibacteria group bacterium]|jgi:hypothetical protein